MNYSTLWVKKRHFYFKLLFLILTVMGQSAVRILLDADFLAAPMHKMI